MATSTIKMNTDTKLQSDIGIVIDGNKTTHTGGVAVGQYVIVRNSTISGITDGLYKATQAIPANTAITSAYLAAVDGGGLNDVIQRSAMKVALSGTTSFSALDNNSYESRALDNLHNSITSRSSGIIDLESSGGPLYYTVLFKYTNDYYSGYLSTYDPVSKWMSYRYAYQAGTFNIYKSI